MGVTFSGCGFNKQLRENCPHNSNGSFHGLMRVKVVHISIGCSGWEVMEWAQGQLAQQTRVQSTIILDSYCQYNNDTLRSYLCDLGCEFHSLSPSPRFAKVSHVQNIAALW